MIVLFISACPKPDVPNGFVKVRKNNYKLYYTCNPGYKLYTDAWWGEAECLGIEWSESVQCIGNYSLLAYR